MVVSFQRMSFTAIQILGSKNQHCGAINEDLIARSTGEEKVYLSIDSLDHGWPTSVGVTSGISGLCVLA